MQNTSLHQEIRWPDPKEITLIDLSLEPKMRIYNGSNPNRYIEESNENIMKAFTKHLEKNKGEISKLSTSNIKVSYEISLQKELSLSFNFEPSDPQSQDSITFINAKNEKYTITKNADIKKLEEKTQIILTCSDSGSPTSHIFTPQEVSMAIKNYVGIKGEIPIHNLIITTDKNRKLSFTESNDELESGEYFAVKSINGDTTLTIGNKTKDELTKIIKEAEERAKREEEKTKKEAEDNAKRETEEKTKKEAEEKAKREAEETSRKEKENIKLRQLFNKTSLELEEAEKLFEEFMKNRTLQPVPEIAEKKKMPMMKEIESEIIKITNIAQSTLSALNLIESTDNEQSSSAIASINKSRFDCARSPKKENNFYEILTEDEEAKRLLIDYLVEYDDGKKSKKLTSLVELITEKNKSYEKPQSPSADKAMIMEDLGVRIFENYKEALWAQGTNVKAYKDYSELDIAEKEDVAKITQELLKPKLNKTHTKLTEFLEKTGYTEEYLKKIIAERSPDSQLNANSADNLSAQANARS